MLGKELADRTGHGQTQVGVNVDFAHGHGGGLAQLVLRDADGAGHIAAVGVDHLNKLLGHGGGAVEHDGEVGQTLLDFFQNVKAELGLGAGLELVSAVAGADGDGQGVAAGLLNKFLHLLRAGVGGILGGDLHVVLNAGEGAQLGLYDDAVVMGILHHLLGDFNVLREGLGAGVDHDGGKAAVDAALAGLEVRAVIQVQRDGDIGALNNSGLHQLHQIGVVGVGAGALGHLQDQGGVDFLGSFRDALDDLHVVDVESADGVTAGIGLFKHLGSSYEGHGKNLLMWYSVPLFYHIFHRLQGEIHISYRFARWGLLLFQNNAICRAWKDITAPWFPPFGNTLLKAGSHPNRDPGGVLPPTAAQFVPLSPQV